jgi:hypothetical protein
MSAPASRAIRRRHVQYRATSYRPSRGTTSRLAVSFPDRWAGRGLACSCTANGAWCRRSALNCIDAQHSSRWCYAVPARHLLTVVKHRADAPCTNVPALARPPALCPKGDPCRRLRESVQATSKTDNPTHRQSSWPIVWSSGRSHPRTRFCHHVRRRWHQRHRRRAVDLQTNGQPCAGDEKPRATCQCVP